MATRVECGCGQRILMPERGTRGKCPRCGRVLEVRGLDEPPTRLGGPPEPRGSGSVLPWILCSGLGAGTLLFAAAWVSLLSRTGDLERRLDAMAERGVAEDVAVPREPEKEGPAPRLPVVVNEVDPDEAARIEGLEAELTRIREEVAGLGRRIDTAAARGGDERRVVAPTTDLEAKVVKLASTVTPSIVSIQNGSSVGSGIIISTDGYILTNDHVVSGAANVAVQLSNGDTVPGRVLGTDSYSDVACVKIEGRDHPAIRLGDSESISVGQVVAALGNPFGISRDGTPTVTLGIVSALHRVIPLSGERQYRDAIQTDAAINPGNSGGALVDLEGRLVGINGAITSTTGTNSGIGFAIPINFVKRILPHLEAGRSPEPGFMGIQVGEMSLDQIRTVGFRGAVVSAVTRGSPAEKAGLHASDIIRKFQGESIESSTRLLNLISYYQVGETVGVEVWRDGRVLDLEITIGPRPR